MKYRFMGLGYDIPVTNMLDAFGDETNDPDEARTVVGPLDNGKWLACQCEFGEIVPQITEH